MKIEVTREIIEGTSGVEVDIFNCVCARSIAKTTGRKVLVGMRNGMFRDGAEEVFTLDDAGLGFITRYLLHRNQYEKKRWFRKPKILQPEGSFEISWNPPAKNWSYKTVQPQVLEEQLA